MAAATAVFQSLLPGDHVLVGRVLYWGVRKWLAEFAITWGLDVELADTTDLRAVQSATLAVTAVFDKPDTPERPTFEETLLVTPSRLPGQVLAAVLTTAGRAARALGLRHGPIHAELRIDTRQGRQAPAMLELAARPIGGLCARALRFTGGVSLEEMVLAAVRRAGSRGRQAIR